MKKPALFFGCKVNHQLKAYQLSTEAVLNHLEIKIKTPEFGCCGYPIRHIDANAWLFSAAKTVAIAEKQGLSILTPCKCCYGSLKIAMHQLNMNPPLKRLINERLLKEHLFVSGNTEINHILPFLGRDFGISNLQARIKTTFKKLKIAVHHGCHALRPSSIVNFGSPSYPSLFETLVAVTGAVPVFWNRRLDCCGAPVADKNTALSIKMMHAKKESARKAGADFFCTACNYCQIHFDTFQTAVLKPGETPMPSLLYPQLLGMALGISEQRLGIDLNTTGPEHLPDLNICRT